MSDQSTSKKPNIVELGVRGFEAISNGLAHLKWILISSAAIMVIILGTVVVVKVNHFFNWFGNGVAIVAEKSTEGVTTAIKKGGDAKAITIEKAAYAKESMRHKFNENVDKLAEKTKELGVAKDQAINTSLSWVERSRNKMKDVFVEEEALAEAP